MKRETRSIRSLRPSESDPPGEPRKYKNRDGYTRLRWKIGKGEYVERYERDESGTLMRDRPPQRRFLDGDLIERLYAEGRPTTEIASLLDCDASHLSRVLRARGVEMRKTGDYHGSFDPDEAVRIYQEKQVGIEELAREMHVSPTRVWLALRERGVTRKPGRRHGSRNGSKPKYETELKRLRPKVFERANGICEVKVPCCIGKATVVHHLRRRSQGGDNSLGNLKACCDPCHRYIHANIAWAYANGHLIPNLAEMTS